jgi:hypothetical protein
LLLASAFAASTVSTFAQSESTVSPQIWLDYDPAWWVTERLQMYGEIGFRKVVKSSGWWRSVIRPSVRYSLDDVNLAGGVGSFYTWNEIIDNRWEVRPWVGLQMTWPRRRITLEHFGRIEQRFDLNTTTWDALASLRVRYRLHAFVQWDAIQPHRYYRLHGSGELFFTVTGEQGQLQEQTRLSIGLERSYRKSFRARIEITWQRNGRYLFEGTVNAIYLRVRLYQTFGG